MDLSDGRQRIFVRFRRIQPVGVGLKVSIRRGFGLVLRTPLFANIVLRVDHSQVLLLDFDQLFPVFFLLLNQHVAGQQLLNVVSVLGVGRWEGRLRADIVAIEVLLGLFERGFLLSQRLSK